MPRSKIPAPPIDRIEKDFMDALDRLVEGRPTHKTLKRKVVNGRVKISITNVALEAGRSRTLIAMKDCRFPRVRELIKQTQSGSTRIPTTHSELITRLRADLAEMKIQKERYQSEAVAQFLARTKAEKEAKGHIATISRLRKELSRVGKTQPLLVKR